MFKKLFLALLLLILFLGCTKKVVRITDLPPLSYPQKAQEDLLRIAQEGAFNLRSQNSERSLILGVDGEKLSLRLLNTKGEDLYLDETKFSNEKLKGFLSTPESEIIFPKGKLISKSPFLYKVLLDGGIEASLDTVLFLGKESYTFPLALIIKVESFNALNFWDANPNNTPKEQMYIYDFLTPTFSNWYDPKVHKAKINSLIKSLRLAGLPEIVGFQEIEYAGGQNEDFKSGSLFRTEMEKLGYKTFIVGPQEKNNPMALTTAFMSRYPLKDLGNIPFNIDHKYFNNFSKEEKKMFGFTTRDMQVVELDLAGEKTRIYNNHWRSQGCADKKSCALSEEIRTNNARILHDELRKTRKENPSMGLIVLGDMNTEYFTNVIKGMNSTGNERAVQDNLKDDLFYNLWFELPEERRFDASNGGFTSTLSQMLINTKLYGNRGLQYIDKSFLAVGQDSPAKDILINADGNPFRWQETKYKAEQTQGEIKEALLKTMKERDCKGARAEARNCRLSYTSYSSQGFFDHLSIQASFRFVGNNYEEEGKTSYLDLNLNENVKLKDIELVVEPCPSMTFVPYPDILKTDFRKAEHFRQCFRLESEKGILTKTEGVYQNAYLETPYGKLGLSMMRSFDPRGIKDGVMIPVPKGEKMHALSNQCFERKILQNAGLLVKSAIGRLGYNNGLLTLFIGTRDDIEFVSLPEDKKKLCR